MCGQQLANAPTKHHGQHPRSSLQSSTHRAGRAAQHAAAVAAHCVTDHSRQRLFKTASVCVCWVDSGRVAPAVWERDVQGGTRGSNGNDGIRQRAFEVCAYCEDMQAQPEMVFIEGKISNHTLKHTHTQTQTPNQTHICRQRSCRERERERVRGGAQDFIDFNISECTLCSRFCHAFFSSHARHSAVWWLCDWSEMFACIERNEMRWLLWWWGAAQREKKSERERLYVCFAESQSVGGVGWMLCSVQKKSVRVWAEKCALFAVQKIPRRYYTQLYICTLCV